MIRLKTLLVESATPQQVEQTNNKQILQTVTSEIDANVQPIFKSMFKQPIIQYVTALNAQSGMISKYIKYKKSNEAVHLYFKTFSDVYFKSLASWGSVTKFAVRKLYSERELRDSIKQNIGKIDEWYENIFSNTFMWLSDPTEASDQDWYSKCSDIITARKKVFLHQLIEAFIKTIYHQEK